jgi:ribonucleoside-diphosphate reductase alpha chain
MIKKQNLTKRNKKNNKSISKVKVDFENLEFPSHEEVVAEIKSKLGEKPKLPKGLPVGAWTEQSLKVLNERYLLKDLDGKVYETPEEMCWRVAWEVASSEVLWGKTRKEVVEYAKSYYNLFVSHEFLPNSPTLMNAGAKNNMQYSACFVLPVEDSLVGIFDALKYQALIHQTGGGTGFSFSRLRPRGSIVRSSKGTASGPVSFMRIFDAATNEIKQGGKRRGANMGILRVDHPDIMEFIHCKDDGGITNFNISVAITDEFMIAYEKDKNYDLIDPSTKKKVGELSAREVFDEIKNSAWKTGDPGVIFIDRRNRGSSNPVPILGPIEATNPCGEQELYAFDACNLGSLFLGYFVKEEKGIRNVDWEKLKKTVKIATRFLDSVIEVNPFPIPEIRKTVLAIRRIGLGVGGWADLLIELGIPYDSEEAIELADKVMGTIQAQAVAESENLAKERGAFPMFELSIYKNKNPRRNATVTTIAPTGTISIIANASSGIEPIFALAYQHIVKDKHLDRTLNFINPKFERDAKEFGVWNEDIKNKVVENGVVRGIEEIPEKLRQIYGTAHEIHHDWHIRMQAAFQKHTENAVSKTINMENTVTSEEIGDAYMLAWKTDCKGITVFRDGCKDAQVLNIGVKKDQAVGAKEFAFGHWERPVKVSGSTYKIKTPVGTAFITVNKDDSGNPFEVFINIGRAGSDVQAMAEALGRLISKSLKFDSSLSSRQRAVVIIDQLRGIGGRRSVGFGINKILSLPDAVSYALSIDLGIKNGNGIAETKMVNEAVEANGDFKTNGHYKNGGSEVVNENLSVVDVSEKITLKRVEETNIYEVAEDEVSIKAIGDICPSCGSGALVYQEGCAKCYACGHSEC